MNDIGPYKINGEIGRGGMGVVYHARDTRLDRDVAIKALPEDLASDAMRLERFEREAKTLASVSHPNIAGIYGVEEVDGARYLVLEFVEGVTLADRLDAGAMDTDEAVELGCQIAAGVAAAHEAGVVHRDLKPANIVITPEGQPKVLDFGLARADEGQSSTGTSEAATLSTPMQHTALGMVVGTAAYMSPEQARGRRVDKRTDIWSFGVILYEMLSGSSPFIGETATDSIGAVLHKDLDLDRLPPGVPTGVRRVIERCLERDKNQRYRDIGDVAIELRRGAEEPAPAAADAKRGVGAVLVAALVLIAAVVGAGAVWVAKPETGAPHVRMSVAAPEGRNVFFAQVTPGGDSVWMWTVDPNIGGASRMAFFRPLDSHKAIAVESSREARWGDFSPDGAWVSFAAPIGGTSSGFQLVKQVVGMELPPVPLTPLPESSAISGYRYLWLSQDRFLFEDSRTNKARFVDAESGAIGDAFEIDIQDYPGRYNSLQSRIDDTRALCILTKLTDRGGQTDIGVLDTETRKVSLLIENTEEAHIGPDGSLLFTRGTTLYGSTLDLDTLEVGPAVQLVADLRSGGVDSDAGFSIGPDGTIVFLPGGAQGTQRRLQFRSESGQDEFFGVEPMAFIELVTLSRDESRALTVVRTISGLQEIWGTEMDEPRMRRVRGVPDGSLNYPYFGPDSDTMVYLRMVDGRAAIEVASFDGLFEPRLIVDPVEEGFIAPLSFHPSGDRALLMWEKPEGFRLYEVPIDGSAPLKPVFTDGSNYTWCEYSPDGTILAYTSDETGRREAYVRTINPDGSFGRPVPVTSRGMRALTWYLEPALQPGVEPSEGQEPPAFMRLGVVTAEGFDVYPVTPGARPGVGEPRAVDLDRDLRRIGSGQLMSDGRELLIVPGENEKPATHAELILNWYDEASKLIHGR